MLTEGAILCCCCCCGEIGSACKRLLGPRKVTKLNYLIIVLAFIVPVLLLTYLLDLLVKWANLTPNQVVARSSLSILMVFLIMMVFILCKNRVSMIVNQGLFTFKYLLIVGFFIISLFLNGSIFVFYSQFARIVSLAYMLIQSVIIIDLFYIAGTKLVKRYNEGQDECGGILVGLSVIFFGSAVSINVLAYINFGHDGCESSIWLNIIVSALLFLMPVVQMIQLNPQNNLLTTSLVALLVSYFSYSAQLSIGGQCRERLKLGTYIADVSVNMFLFVLTTYGTISGGLSEQPEIERVGSQAEQQTAGVKEYSETNTWLQWHFYMCLASIYLCMVFSNWLSIENVGKELRGSDFAFTVRATASVGTAMLYVWTMIAPGVFPQRSFEIE